MANVWWQQSSSIRNSFIKSTGSNTEQTRAWVLFYVVLHDFGKLDVRFQLKVPQLAPYEDKDIQIDCKKYFHGEQGYYWYYRDTEGNAALLIREGELNLSVIPMLEKEGKDFFE